MHLKCGAGDEFDQSHGPQEGQTNQSWNKSSWQYHSNLRLHNYDYRLLWPHHKKTSFTGKGNEECQQLDGSIQSPQ